MPILAAQVTKETSTFVLFVYMYSWRLHSLWAAVMCHFHSLQGFIFAFLRHLE